MTLDDTEGVKGHYAILFQTTCVTIQEGASNDCAADENSNF